MIGEIGIYSLILVIVFSSFGSFFFINYQKNNNFKNQSIFQEKVSGLIFFLTLISFICLTYSFLTSDFSLSIVSKNSNSQLPLIYKFTGVWGNHEGSILLWLLVMTVFGYFFSKKKEIDFELKKNVLGVQNFLSLLFSCFVLFTSNPFERNLVPVVEGSDLNPLLQDPGLAIHPPFLYFGYVGFSIVYSIAIATLLVKKKQVKMHGMN